MVRKPLFDGSNISLPIEVFQRNMDRHRRIIDEIRKLERELISELQQKEEAFFYQVKGGKVFFEREARKRQRAVATHILRYLQSARLLNILSSPFIWACLLPALLMDLVVSVFQLVCFRIYGIPKVARRDYFTLDRGKLDYLNGIEKLNCVYCGYFNGLIAYVQEIAARTEQYWCPIKHASRLPIIHSRYHKFLDYGDFEDFREKVAALRQDFGDIENGAISIKRKT